ncbi:MAG: DUF3276 family protein [Chitinophagaceae bacterium]
MSYENNHHTEREHENETLYSKRLKAGKRRTYFFDVRATRGNDYFLTITESKKRFNDDGYDRHKIFLYKEDFNKFIAALTEAVDHVKTELLPNFDFDSFSHEDYEHHENAMPVEPTEQTEEKVAEATAESEDKTSEVATTPASDNNVVVDKW